MHLDFKKIFSKPATVRIRARRQITLKNAQGELVEVRKGDELEILQADLGNYDGDDIGILKSPAVMAIPDPSPLRPDAAPLPAGWDKLPECFAAFHEISEELRTAAEHLELIEAKRIEIFGGRLGRIGEATGKIFMGKLVANADPRDKNVRTSLTEIDMDDPETKAIDRFLSAAEDSARDHLTRLREARAIPLQRKFLECGTARLEVFEKLQQIMTELSDTGFAIFQTRIAALGLHRDHERRLFIGSADYLAYSSHGIPAIHDLRSAGLNETGQSISYIDAPVTSTAQVMISDMEQLATFQPLLVTAKRELAQARKIAA